MCGQQVPVRTNLKLRRMCLGSQVSLETYVCYVFKIGVYAVEADQVLSK